MLRKPCRLQTDRRTDGQTDKVNPVYPPSNFVGRGYNYISEVYRQLGNPSHYKKLDEPIFHSTGQKINEILSDLHQQNFISSKQLLYLKPPLEPHARRFYLLPKIHKPLDKWPIKNQMPPGRPIISDCDSASYKVAEYIDHFLQEISQKHPSYIKDTYDFLSKLCTAKVQPHTLFITLDVESMYTNIDNEQGLEAVRNVFQANPSPRHSDKHILELLELSLKNNDLNSTTKLFYKSQVLQWARNLHPVMQICSWHNGKIQPWKNAIKTNNVL